MLSTDAEWERWGSRDPYFAVLTDPDFRGKQLNSAMKDQFFLSGQSHVNAILNQCRRYFGDDFSPTNVLDYGCGVGRCTIPFARVAQHVCGIDVSDSMLHEAKANCDRLMIHNVQLHNIKNGLDQFTNCYDLIHSFIVFQHIPTEQGLRLLKRLIHLLGDNSVGVIHMTFGKRLLPSTFGFPGAFRRFTNRTLDRLYRQFQRLLCKSVDPEMQMNSYNLSQVCYILQTLDIQTVHMDFTDHDGALGVVLYFRKKVNSNHNKTF
jgi:SAM-dependent methyltransferase